MMTVDEAREAYFNAHKNMAPEMTGVCSIYRVQSQLSGRERSNGWFLFTFDEKRYR
jgi:hypothetical protein